MVSDQQGGLINYNKVTNGKESQERVQYQEKPTKNDVKKQLDMSFNSWKRINSGYVIPSETKTTNQMAFSSTLLNEADSVDKTHFRVADKHSHYIEATVRYKLLSGNTAKTKNSS